MNANPSAMPTVSVLIPVLNEEAHIRDTVATMLAQELPEGMTLELVFADGRSEDRTKAVLEEMAADDPRIVVVDNPARTTAAGLNACLRAARGDYIARMDAHAWFPARYLAAGIERLERGDDVVWVAGPVVPRGSGGGIRATVAYALGSRLGVGGSSKWRMNAEGRPAEEVELDTGVFAGVWRRETVDRHHGWDDGWPVNQDSELAARVLAEGGRIVSRAEMAAEYLPRDNLRALWRQYWRHGFYRAKTATRHHGTLRKTHFLPPAVALCLAAALLAPTRTLRRLARLGVATYGGALALQTLDAAREVPPKVALPLPAVLATMHVAWGLGFVAGWARFGLASARGGGGGHGGTRAGAEADAGARPRIVHVMGWESKQYGSFERFLVALTRRCAELGAESHLVFHEPVRSQAFLADVEAAGVYVVPKARQVGDPLNTLRLGRVLRDAGATHLHAHFGYDSYNALAVARPLGVERRFTTKHIVPATSWKQLPGPRHRWLARQVEAFWPVSEWVADHLRRLGVPEEKIEVIHLGVDPAAYAPDPALRAATRAALDVGDETRLILCASHLRPGKGTELLPGIAAQLADDPGGVVLLAAGDGALRGQIEAEAATLGLGPDAFRLLGVREDIPALLAAADLFLFPTQANEGMPLGVLEAMAAGLPVVATEVSDVAKLPRDVVKLVPQGDAAALVAGCRALLSDPDDAARRGAASRELVIARFSLESAVERHVARYFAPRP